MKSKEQKRKEARARLNQWASMTTDEQITELQQRPGACKKQLNRIVRRTIDAQLSR